VASGGGGVYSAQGSVGVTGGKHFFQVSVTAASYDGNVAVGWVDDKLVVRLYGLFEF
jgi:hypothetical protein